MNGNRRERWSWSGRMQRGLVLIGVLLALLAFWAPVATAAECPCPIMVSIDVKPGSYPNPIDLRSRGLIPVALLGSAEFDVAAVDLSTVGLHPMGRPEQAVPPVRYAFEDVDGDGYLDILFFFKTRDTAFQPGDTMACLHGYVTSGEHFCGHDTIVVIG